MEWNLFIYLFQYKRNVTVIHIFIRNKEKQLN